VIGADGAHRNLLRRWQSQIFGFEGESFQLAASRNRGIFISLQGREGAGECVCFRNQAMRFKDAGRGWIVLEIDRTRIDQRVRARGEYQIYVEHLSTIGCAPVQFAFEQPQKAP